MRIIFQMDMSLFWRWVGGGRRIAFPMSFLIPSRVGGGVALKLAFFYGGHWILLSWERVI